MSSSAVLLLIIALLVGGFAGWNARSARGANADLKLYKSRIPRLRQARTRSGLISLVVVILALLAVRALILR